MVDEAKLRSSVRSAFEALVVQCVWSGVVENGALSVGQCCLQTLQFSVHLMDLLSSDVMDGFTAIQKVVMDQTGSRPPNRDHDLFSSPFFVFDHDFFWCKYGFKKCFGASPTSH